MIRRTVRVVRKIHEENEQRKLIIEELVRGQGGGAAAAEKMVQVVRGGTIYFVPESEALATDELVGPEAYGPAEEGFLWAEGSSALAAPQRRTMHRCCA